MRKIILIVFATFITFATFGVLANHLVMVSAPTLAGKINDAEPRQAAVASEKRPALAVPTQGTTVSLPKPVAEPIQQVQVSDVEQPVAQTQEALASDEPAAPLVPEIVPAPEFAAVASEPGRYLKSEWLEVPMAVVERDRHSFSAELRTTAEAQNAAPGPVNWTNENVRVHETSTASADAEIPATTANSILPFIKALGDVTSSIFGRELLSIPNAPAAPFVGETFAAVTQHNKAIGDAWQDTVTVPTVLSPSADVSSSVVWRGFQAIPNAPAAPLSDLRAISGKHYEFAVGDKWRERVAEPAFIEASAGVSSSTISRQMFELPNAPAAPLNAGPFASVKHHELTLGETWKDVVAKPNFLNASAGVSSSIIGRQVFELPSAPPAPVNIGTFASAKHFEFSTGDRWKEASALSLAISSTANVSSAVVRRQLLSVPEAPAAPFANATFAAARQHQFGVGDTWQDAVAKVVTQDPARVSYPAIIDASANVSSFIIGREPLAVPVAPAAPMATEALATIKQHQFADKDPSMYSIAEPLIYAESMPAVKHFAGIGTSRWNEPVQLTETASSTNVPAKQVPVLISSQTSFSQEMLKPLGTGTLPSETIFKDTLVASNKGPSVEALSADTVKPKKETGPLPVLINRNPGFSLDMLKPLSKPVAAPRPFYEPTAKPTVSGTSDTLPAANTTGGYCDPAFVGEPIRFSQTIELKLEDLLNQIHNRFGVNFITGPNIGNQPLNVKAGSLPWNVLLRSQLFISGVRARCVDANTIELVENKALSSLQDMAEVKTRFVKLKFLQRTGGGSVDLANRTQGGQTGNQGGGCASSGSSGSGQFGGISNGSGGQTAGQLGSSKFDKLIVEIEKILGIRSMTESTVGSTNVTGGGQGTVNQQTEVVRTNRFVTQIPGRNILAIRATDEEWELINEIITRADRPPFQVVIKGLVYTANEDLLRDLGVKTSITGGNANDRVRGGLVGDTLGVSKLLDISTMIGTVDFNLQVTAFQQNGVISVKSRPFATVLDGLCTTLEVGRQIPIVIDSTLGGQGDVVFVSASDKLAVTPYVVDDDNGNPMAVTLELRLDSNGVDRTVSSDQPTVSVRSINTQLLLNEDKTAILGGFTVDQDSRSVSKTPGLGDIPLLGELFKRRVRTSQLSRLYFAISVSVIPYGQIIEPVNVPGATTQPPTITPEMLKRSEKAEPKTVPTPTPTPKKDPN